MLAVNPADILARVEAYVETGRKTKVFLSCVKISPMLSRVPAEVLTLIADHVYALEYDANLAEAKKKLRESQFGAQYKELELDTESLFRTGLAVRQHRNWREHDS